MIWMNLSMKNDMPSWDCVLICRNEEKTLPKLFATLENFKKRGGKTFICDTGSKDNSVAVARAWGATVAEMGDTFRTTVSKEVADAVNKRFIVEGEEPILTDGDTCFDFASARNYAASLASNDWVWQPDCDEYFTTLDLDKIDEAIATPGISRLRYEYVFSHASDGSPLTAFRHSKCYDRKKMEWRGRVHEVLASKEGEERHLDLPPETVKLEHSQNHATNRRGYLVGLALSAYEGGTAAESEDRCAHYFARELLWAGRYRSAIKEFERHVAMGKWPAEASQSLVFAAQAHKALGNDTEAVKALHEAVRLEAGRREPFIRLAEHYTAKQDWQRVACYAAAALQVPSGGFYADDMEHYRGAPFELLYCAWYWLGDKQKAKEAYAQALFFNPNKLKIVEDRQFFYP